MVVLTLPAVPATFCEPTVPVPGPASSAGQSSGWHCLALLGWQLELERSRVLGGLRHREGQSPPRGPVLGRLRHGGVLEPAGTATEALALIHAAATPGSLFYILAGGGEREKRASG